MPRITSPKEMRQRRDGMVGYITTPKPRYDYRVAPAIGTTDTGIKLLDADRDFAIIASFHCPDTSATAPATPSGHSPAGIYHAAGNVIGIRSYFEPGATVMGRPMLHNTFMSRGRFGPVFGWDGNETPFSPAGGRLLITHRQEYSSLISELCGQSAVFAVCNTFTTSATDTLQIISNPAVVIDMVAVYLDTQLTAEEEVLWRCYGLVA